MSESIEGARWGHAGALARVEELEKERDRLLGLLEIADVVLEQSDMRECAGHRRIREALGYGEMIVLSQEQSERFRKLLGG